MSLAYELAMQKRNTSAYIASDPSAIVLQRQASVADDAGGKTLSATPVNGGVPQTMRVITNSNRTVSVSRRDVNGVALNPDLTLLAEWDADIAIMDKCEIGGATYVVTWVYDDLRYEIVADLMREGSDG